MQHYELRLTSAMVINGKIVRAGTNVTLDKRTAEDFLRRGRAELISAVDEEEGAANPDAQPDLSRLNKGQLLEVAAQLGIDVDDGLTKAEIILAIEEGGK